MTITREMLEMAAKTVPRKCTRCLQTNDRERHSTCRSCHAGNMREYRARRSRMELQNAILSTRSLVKLPCFLCGSQDSHKRVTDKTRPLDVLWICSHCWRLMDGKIWVRSTEHSPAQIAQQTGNRQ